MSNKILGIYRSILKYSGMEADEQGYIVATLGDKRDPAFIDGLRLVLPTDHQLRNYDPKEKMVFHPFTENILRGESEIINKLKLAINVKLNFTVGVIGQSLLTLVASPELHSKLNPEQAELLTVIKEADQKSVTDFITQMMQGIKNTPDRLFSNVYLKRGGNYKGKRFSRVGIVTFPFYDKILEDSVDKIRVKDKATFKQLMEFIFPNLSVEDEYNFGSDSHVAPYLEALLRTSANIASRLNDIILTYKDFIDEADSLSFDADWLEDFQDLAALQSEIRKIPMQAGNDGSLSTEEVQQAQVVQAPQQMQMNNQQPMMYPNQMVQMQAPVSTGIKTTKRGLDFKSLMQNAPALQMQGNMLAPVLMQNQMQQMMQQQQMQQPSWAGNPNQGNIVMTPNGPVMLQPNMMPTQQGNMMMPMYPQQPQQPSWAGQPAMMYPNQMYR